MPVISKRSDNSYTSPIRKLSVFADQAKQRGTHVYHLNIGQPDIKTPKAALEKVRNIDLDILAYSPSRGYLSYREKLIGYYNRFDIHIQAEDLIITNGASEGIYFSLMGCFDKGDEVLVPEPFYALYNGFSELAGINIQPITSSIETGFSLPEIDEFEKYITSKTKAIFLCNPNNPTGCLYPKEDLERLAKLVKKHDLFLIVDEVYREFCYDDQEFYSVLNLPNTEEHVVVIDSVSKRFSACGARVGTIITRNTALIKAIIKYAEFRLSPPTFGQIFAEATIDIDENYLKEAKAEYDKRRNLLVSRLQAIDGVTCKRPGGAFYVFVALPIDDGERFCKWLLEEFTHEGATLMLAPGAGFYATSGLGKQEVRIAYVLNTTALNKAMDCLEKALAVYPYRVKNKETAFQK